jgi:hypothetical protein
MAPSRRWSPVFFPGMHLPPVCSSVFVFEFVLAFTLAFAFAFAFALTMTLAFGVGTLCLVRSNWSGKVLNAIAPIMPELLGGSADLAPSNKTEIKCSGDYQHVRHGVAQHRELSPSSPGAPVVGLLLPLSHAGAVRVRSLAPNGACAWLLLAWVCPSACMCRPRPPTGTCGSVCGSMAWPPSATALWPTGASSPTAQHS